MAMVRPAPFPRSRLGAATPKFSPPGIFGAEFPWPVYYSITMRLTVKELRAMTEGLPDDTIMTVSVPLVVGDLLSYEDRRTGIRYRCTVAELRPDGWAIHDGSPGGLSFHPTWWELVTVVRLIKGKKRLVYELYVEDPAPVASRSPTGVPTP